jgi:hypothetical protein
VSTEDSVLKAHHSAGLSPRVALARHACRLCYRMIKAQEPFNEQRYRRNRLSRGR